MTQHSKAASNTTDEPEPQQSHRPIMENAQLDADPFANLTIRVHKRQRLHWLIEAKKQGTSLTAAITDALNERFGTPE